MSGGGSSKSKPKTSAATPSGPSPTQTVQPFMPGNDNALAAQLAAGFGGLPADFMAAFQQTYAPMQVPTGATYQPTPATGGGGTPTPAPSRNPSLEYSPSGKWVKTDGKWGKV